MCRRQPLHRRRRRRRQALRRARGRQGRALYPLASAGTAAGTFPASGPVQRAQGRIRDQTTLGRRKTRARPARNPGNMSPTAKAQWQMHFCVLLWGFTAILGKAITLPAMALVVWRMGLVTLALLLVPRVWRGLRALPLRLVAIYAGIGFLVALHWLTFYGAIKLANASVAVTCIALATVFVPLVEPWVTGKRFQARELLLGVAAVPGVALVVGGVPSGM